MGTLSLSCIKTKEVRKVQYNKYPCVHIKGHAGSAVEGCDQVISAMKKRIANHWSKRFVLMIDCYPGVLYDEIRESLIDPLKPETVIFTDDEIFQDAKGITERVKDRLTDDRVFGQMCLENYTDLLSDEGYRNTHKKLDDAKGLVIVYGAGARLLTAPDLYVYADMARWELQLRFRKDLIPEWKCCEKTTDNLEKFKWGYFFAWRVADRHKKKYFEEIDYFLDTNQQGCPKLITGEALRDGLIQTVVQPFRVVPFFDPGVWGGQWMKKVCCLDADQENYAWCFDCVPEENSLLLESDGITVEIPSIDVVFYKPKELLGKKVYARFGAEFPIRFDFLDTMQGQNLSLQVHPLVGYIQDKFGMHYTQEESYYILDVDEKENPGVYLGVKTGTEKAELIDALARSQEGNSGFDDEKYINRISVKKHDHVLIPPGTIHCSSKGMMVLEISATPYIFTFKLWDWNRLGMDGKPRPIYLHHGSEVVQMDRDTEYVNQELVNRIEVFEVSPGIIRERTGLHELEFIESERLWFDEEAYCETHGSVNVLNLVEGDQITIKSPSNAFDPFIVNFAETFIMPEQLGKYILSASGDTEKGKSQEAKKKYGVIIARVRV